MNNVLQWIFWSKKHLAIAVASTLATCVLLLLLVATARAVAPASGDRAADATPTAAPMHTELIPPVQPDATPSPTPSYGPVEPIVLEAVDAFLANDTQRFSRVALPGAVEAVADAPHRPASAQKITGEVDVIEPGPTQQTVEIPTSGGTLQMIMVISDARWQVSGIRYRP